MQDTLRQKCSRGEEAHIQWISYGKSLHSIPDHFMEWVVQWTQATKRSGPSLQAFVPKRERERRKGDRDRDRQDVLQKQED